MGKDEKGKGKENKCNVTLTNEPGKKMENKKKEEEKKEKRKTRK